ncbi:MAG: LytR C-terminal domain-containing protein, partial [candidate division Zixibacteria bacterium]|nr:LytR C-terminal domain-containing protein [candidate division Zixibacteria bacterium]
MPRKRRTKIPLHKAYQTRISARPSRGLNYLIGVLSLVVLVFASSTILKVLSGETSSLPIERSYLRVQVLNGCGVLQAAATMASIIREAGIPNVDFDVIDADNFDTFEVSATMILVRDERA